MTELKYKVGETVKTVDGEAEIIEVDMEDTEGMPYYAELSDGLSIWYTESEIKGVIVKVPVSESATVKFDRATVEHIAETVERIDQTAGGNNSAALHGIHSYLGGLLEGIDYQ